MNEVALKEEFKENFRMKRENFEKLCEELRPLLQGKETTMRKPIPVDTQVAATLYYLSVYCVVNQHSCFSTDVKEKGSKRISYNHCFK